MSELISRGAKTILSMAMAVYYLLHELTTFVKEIDGNLGLLSQVSPLMCIWCYRICLYLTWANSTLGTAALKLLLVYSL